MKRWICPAPQCGSSDIRQNKVGTIWCHVCKYVTSRKTRERDLTHPLYPIYGFRIYRSDPDANMLMEQQFAPLKRRGGLKMIGQDE